MRLKNLYLLVVLNFFMTLNLFCQEKIKIEVVFLFNVDKDLEIYLQDNLSKIFNASVSISTKEVFLEDTYNQERRQYFADRILKKFYRRKPDSYLLLIFDKDLYTEGLNFIFGQAIPEQKLSIISLARLDQKFYGLPFNKSLFYLRSLKEAVHEIGHLLGLGHCKDKNCVMYFSNSLLDTDNKDFKFCPICKKKIDFLLYGQDKN